VPQVNPVTVDVIEAALVPLAMLPGVAPRLDPYAVLVPKSNESVAVALPAVALPLNVACVCEMLLGVLVVAVGATGVGGGGGGGGEAHAAVVNATSLPMRVPYEFCAPTL
jgi:hypothetical protein